MVGSTAAGRAGTWIKERRREKDKLHLIQAMVLCRAGPICSEASLFIGACRPGHARELPGLFRSIAYSYHKDRTRRRAAGPQTSISVPTHVQTYV